MRCECPGKRVHDLEVLLYFILFYLIMPAGGTWNCFTCLYVFRTLLLEWRNEGNWDVWTAFFEDVDGIETKFSKIEGWSHWYTLIYNGLQQRGDVRDEKCSKSFLPDSSHNIPIDEFASSFLLEAKSVVHMLKLRLIERLVRKPSKVSHTFSLHPEVI